MLFKLQNESFVAQVDVQQRQGFEGVLAEFSRVASALAFRPWRFFRTRVLSSYSRTNGIEVGMFFGNDHSVLTYF